MGDSSDFTIMMDIWLVVEPYPSEKYEFVSWGYEIPSQMEKLKFMFQTTNQKQSVRSIYLNYMLVQMFACWNWVCK